MIVKYETLLNQGLAFAGKLTAESPTLSNTTTIARRLSHTPQLLATLIARRDADNGLEHATLVNLAAKIEAVFNKSELNNLCFRLDVDWDNVPGSTKSDKAREVVLLVRRHGRLQELVTICQELRPKYSWDEWLSTGEPQIAGTTDLVIIVDLASRYKTILSDVATHLDENTTIEANILWFHNPNKDRHIDLEPGWDAFAHTFTDAIPQATQLTGARNYHFFLAGPSPILFAMGCVFGTVKKGNVYHLDGDTYRHVLTISQALHR